ncbi:probable acetyl-CoA carboxylase carboxyl transferase subunit [Brevibacillus brevis NBRC 100599]|uniref:Acetyl-coenzyme A carboxylase carboxyl transferase subunit alpha n=1 Tax=Brevibacillus brevis (strain 47 / JCM 6285 / NBRC 100599) TaxID=358681 RepID=C0ZEF2_BREBN|nr:acetyl-CoA carboxylase carboxyltransferase subunit alpha [Brevibacillus brevis]BAH44161.1 probable acetyl-CoA carboxylase carboxyl transferase subunit [Brevibacillus brevis NBRC 100599]
MSLDFEGPIIELKEKIDELQKYMEKNDLDLSSEIHALRERLKVMQSEIYTNISPFQRVQIARLRNRPTTLDYIPLLFTDFIELHGDRLYGDDKAIIGGIAKYKGMPVTIIGHQRGRNTKESIERNFGMAHPEGYRKALRLMKQAEKFNRPIITFIDTSGAYPGRESEERGISEAIARNLFEMVTLRVPIICIVIGEASSGGALGISIGNHIHMLDNSWYSVISPEGAASILWKDAKYAPKAAEYMKITAKELKDLGIIDQIIPEVKGGAQNDIKWQAEMVESAIESSLKELVRMSPEELTQQRYEKYREMGKIGILNGTDEEK